MSSSPSDWRTKRKYDKIARKVHITYSTSTAFHFAFNNTCHTQRALRINNFLNRKSFAPVYSPVVSFYWIVLFSFALISIEGVAMRDSSNNFKVIN